MELEATRGTIVVYRSRNNESVGLTKSDRFRSVQIGHYYGHLERHVLGAGALATEDAITRAAVRQR